MPKYTRFQLAVSDTDHPGSAKIQSMSRLGMHVIYANKEIGFFAKALLPDASLSLDEQIDVPILDLKYVGNPVVSLPPSVKRAVVRRCSPDAGDQILQGTIVGATPFEYKIQCHDGLTRYIGLEDVTGKSYESLYK